MAKGQRPVSTAVNTDQADARMDDFAERWGAQCPAAVKLWRSAWGELIPFLDNDVEIRKINLHDQRDRELERPLPARRPGPGHFPKKPPPRLHR